MPLSPERKRYFIDVLIKAQGGACARCRCRFNYGDPADPFYPTLDHVQPRRAKVPRDNFDNYQVLCLACNGAKADHEPTRREINRARRLARRLRSQLALDRHLSTAWWTRS
jgi:5-methylcytosine-specific restriction endonuclease McrA